MKTALRIVALVLAGALPLGASAADATKSAPATGTGSTTGQTPPAQTTPSQTAPSVTTPAEMGKPEVPPMFKELDTNRDGQISRDEAKRSAEVLSTFDSLDTDHNGKVSLLEWNAAEMKKQHPKQ